MENSKFIQVINVSKSFDDIEALKDISFSITQGEFISIVGQSGCGKTTLLNIISKLIKPSTGNILINQELVKDKEHFTGYVFQFPMLLDWKTVLDNVLLPVSIQKNKINGIYTKKAIELLKMLGIEQKQYSYPYELSGGQKQRVAIARALILDPEVLVMDEPFGSLDSMTREKLHLVLIKLWKKTKKTVVFVTHSISEAVLLSNKIVILTGFPGYVNDIIDIPDFKVKESNILASVEISKIVTEVRKRVKYLWSDETPLLQKEKFDKKEKKKNLKYTIISILLLPIILFLIDFIRYIMDVSPYILPSMSEIYNTAILSISSGELLKNALVTLREALSGFSISFPTSLILGYIFAKSKAANKIFMPYIIAFQTIPIIALAPLLIIWFGFGIESKIYTAAITCIFPMIVSNMVGIKSADKELAALFKFMKANLFQTFIHFEFPSALPNIIGSIRMGFTFSIIGAVVGEFMGGSKGLGVMLHSAKEYFNTPKVFVTIIFLSLIGIFFHLITLVIENIFIFWIKKGEK